jgi:hypothetical protein
VNWFFFIPGMLILLSLLTVVVFFMARDIGVKVALGVAAFTVGLTAIVVGAALLIGYGIQGVK